MRKMYRCFVILLVLTLFATGCGKYDKRMDMKYEIVEEDGKFYMVFDEPVQRPNSESGIADGGSVYFDSVAEMKKDIETGNFTETEWYEISKFWTNRNGRISICDLSNLQVPETPAGVEYGVTWFGLDCEFQFSAESGIAGSWHTRSKTVFEDWVTGKKHFGENDLVEFRSQTTDAERNAAVYVYNTGTGNDQKAMYYVLNSGDKVLHVWESYADITQSNLVPSDITIYGSENGAYYCISLYGFQERPSVEWLLKFGMTNYEEEASWLLPAGVGCAVLAVGVGIFVLCKKKKQDTPTPAEEGEHGEQ